MTATTTEATPIVVSPDRLVTVALYAKISGMTDNAIRCKLKQGVWVEGREYVRAPDGTIWIDREGVYKWRTSGV